MSTYTWCKIKKIYICQLHFLNFIIHQYSNELDNHYISKR